MSRDSLVIPKRFCQRDTEMNIVKFQPFQIKIEWKFSLRLRVLSNTKRYGFSPRTRSSRDFGFPSLLLPMVKLNIEKTRIKSIDSEKSSF